MRMSYFYQSRHSQLIKERFKNMNTVWVKSRKSFSGLISVSLRTPRECYVRQSCVEGTNIGVKEYTYKPTGLAWAWVIGLLMKILLSDEGPSSVTGGLNLTGLSLQLSQT